jgi:hypothetical protein
LRSANQVPDNTTAEGRTTKVATAADLRMFGTAAIFLLMGQGPTESEIVDMTRSVTMVCNTADALDALREAVKGCGRVVSRQGQLVDCGDTDDVRCSVCRAKRDAAISRLISESGDNHGRE